MSTLDRLLTKRGIKNVEDLQPDEKAVYEKYRVILSGELVTVATLKEFCLSQIRLIETKFGEADMTNDAYLKACLHVYLNLVKAIEAPEAERASLEKYLTQLIEN